MAFKNIEELAQGIAAAGQNWSDADRALAAKDIDYGNSLFTLKNDWVNATKRGDSAGAQNAHDRAEDFRKRYGGYSGGADGSGYVKDSTFFNYDDPHAGTLNDLAEQLVNQKKFKNPYQGTLEDIAGQLRDYGAFVNPYQDKTDKVLDQYLNRDPFSYDLDSDPIWGQYQKTYLREGQRAREDALGSYAAATGGQSSTAAVNAASQAQDYYNAQMADKIPELYKLNYDMWLGEGNQYASQLDALRGLGADALTAWDANRGLLNDQLSAYRQLGSDALSEWDANRTLLNDQLSGIRGLSEDGYNRALNKWQADYGVDRDSIGDTRYTDEMGYNRQQDALDREDARKKQALAQALEWMQMGLTPSDAVLSAAGLSGQDAAQYVGAVQAQLLAKASGRGSGGGSGRSSGGTTAAGSTSGDPYNDLFMAAKREELNGGSASNYISQNYKKYGFTKSTGLSDQYKAENKDAGDNAALVGIQDVMKFMTKEQRVDYIEKAQKAGKINQMQARQLLNQAGVT